MHTLPFIPWKAHKNTITTCPRSICLLVLLLAKVLPEPLPVIAVISFSCVCCSDFLLDSSAFRCVYSWITVAVETDYTTRPLNFHLVLLITTERSQVASSDKWNRFELERTSQSWLGVPPNPAGIGVVRSMPRCPHINKCKCFMYSVCVGVHLWLKSVKSRGDFSSITELMHTHTHSHTSLHSLTHSSTFYQKGEGKKTTKKLFGFCLSQCV